MKRSARGLTEALVITLAAAGVIGALLALLSYAQ